MKKYSKRMWLNKAGSPSTGAAVAYHGPSPWGHREPVTFFEVSDCQNSIRLYQSDIESRQEFISKMRKLAQMASDFADALEADV